MKEKYGKNTCNTLTWIIPLSQKYGQKHTTQFSCVFAVRDTQLVHYFLFPARIFFLSRVWHTHILTLSACDKEKMFVCERKETRIFFAVCTSCLKIFCRAKNRCWRNKDKGVNNDKILTYVNSFMYIHLIVIVPFFATGRKYKKKLPTIILKNSPLFSPHFFYWYLFVYDFFAQQERKILQYSLILLPNK